MKIDARNRICLPKELAGRRYYLLSWENKIYFLSERVRDSFLEKFLSFEEMVFGSKKAEDIGSSFFVTDVESDGRVLIPPDYWVNAGLSRYDEITKSGDNDCFYLEKVKPTVEKKDSPARI